MLSPIVNEKGKTINIISVSRDITEQKDLELRKDFFISAASHELKTPLTSQLSYIQLLSTILEGENNKNAKKLIKKIARQTKRLETIVMAVLDSAAMEDNNYNYSFHKFSFKKIVNESLKELKPLMNNHKIVVKGNITKEILIDKLKICQVIKNLVNNAIKFSPDSDKVIIELVEKNDQLIFKVRDFGIGVARKDRERIFTKFYRVMKNNGETYPGLGLGLFISREIIKRHGGDIWVESRKNKGSTFSFSLPLN